MSEISRELGVIAVLAKRMVEERLPKALVLKQRVDQGEVLNELDLAFLEQIVTDIRSIEYLIQRNPRVGTIAARMLQLYDEIGEKALANEQARTGAQH